MLVESGIREHFACGIRNPWPYNPENTAQGIRNPNNDWNPESRIQVSTDKGWNPVPGIRNLPHGIQNPRRSWIPLREMEKRRFVGSQALHQQSLNSLFCCAKSVKILPSVPRKLILLKF